jgi:hypothetical protein
MGALEIALRRYKEYVDKLGSESGYVFKHLNTYIKKLLFEKIDLDLSTEHIDIFILLDGYPNYYLYKEIKKHITEKKKRSLRDFLKFSKNHNLKDFEKKIEQWIK